LIEQIHRWQRTAAAAAAIALLGFSATEASALSLGRITVQSALGEPLRAEIEVPSISAEEASSLKANAASPAAFVAAGLEYNPAMSGLQATLARRPDGRAYIRLSSERVISEPFVDMILEASWSAGRIVRDYTMLFDPPSLKQAVAPTLPQTPAAPAPAPVRVAPAAVPAAAANRPVAPVAPAVAIAPPKAAAAPTETGKVTVKSGDSASKIASRSKAADVSLDQMLVALLRSNPDAFSKGNLNRLRAGAVLDVPSSEQARAIPLDEAKLTVIAQSKDFNEYRRNLASNAPTANVAVADRKASGSVEAKVADKKPGSDAADKLTLSKGALQAKANEAKIAQERAAKDAADRAAELAKNMADMKKLSAATAQKAATAAAKAASAPASAPVAPAIAVAVAPVVPAPVVAPVVSAPVTPPVMPASAVSPVAKPVAAAPVVEEPGLLDQIMEDPTLPLAGGGLLALIGGFAFYRRQQAKKRAAHVDSSFLESRLQPDSFFGASGGQRVDTANEAPSSVSSYTNSQLGTADDVDPVAEADVYLAYGRDVQAEEILKEAMLHNPGRLAIHSKLLDVYAKRGDTSNFSVTANKAFQLVGADTPEWTRICELGLTIDPQNPLYQPGGAPESAFSGQDTVAMASEPGDSTVPVTAHVDLSSGSSDLDLDLDFSADDVPTYGTPLVNGPAIDTAKLQAPAFEAPAGLDFDISAPGELDYDPPPSAHAALEPDEMPTAMSDLARSMEGLNLGNLDLDEPAEPSLELPEFKLSGHQSLEATAALGNTSAEDGMLEFDLGSLSLDLGTNAEPLQEEDPTGLGESSLETKLALAEEFVSIGDQDGARALIEEVVAEASGELRDKALRALAKLS
jgi:pilus assembly protein FimV